MDKIADFIESWILNRLQKEADNVVVLRRNELAEELACAPSQISYVLNTRFTVERGYIVESRRGSGGYVRIARIPIQAIVFEDAARQITKDASLPTFQSTILRLRSHGLLTDREAALLSQFCDMMSSWVGPEEQGKMLRRLLLTLVNRGEKHDMR
ncbi:MAG: CtsR family transcriptional regulator [Negativicutes bacterium]|nr:CtsR family transcriptional regulator [Negativicutes bacterium]